MIRRLQWGWIIPALGLASCSTPSARIEPTVNPWARVDAPAPGEASAIGTNAAGCLRGAERLPEHGIGYRTVRRSRNRFWAHPAMARVLDAVGLCTKEANEPEYLVGDVGMPRGGPTLSGHASHQTGLDVDVWYWRPGHSLSAAEAESVAAPTLVDPKARAILPRAMTPGVVALLRRFAERPEVERIFVNPAIKRWLCDHRSSEPWIRKTRPWFGHERHFHVRLFCPAADGACVSSAPIPEGNGCDATLDWWWSDEARAQQTEKTSGPPKMPILPSACDTVLKAQ